MNTLTKYYERSIVVGTREEPAMTSVQTSPELPTLAGVEHRFFDLPGLRMHVAEAGSGEPLLLLHGFPQHWWAWRTVVPALAAHYRVICPDLPGSARRRLDRCPARRLHKRPAGGRCHRPP